VITLDREAMRGELAQDYRRRTRSRTRGWTTRSEDSSYKESEG